MNNEIKEILDNLRKTADNSVFVVCSTQEELDKIPKYTANFMSINDRKAKQLLDYITNLQQKIEQYENPDDMTLFYMWLDVKAKDKMKELEQENEDYKSRCEKASEKLGNYKHYSTPTEEQNSENEDIVDSALNILQNGSEDNG